MIYSTATVPVNPEGETPLTRAQAWAGPGTQGARRAPVPAARPLHPLRCRGGKRDALRARSHHRRP